MTVLDWIVVGMYALSGLLVLAAFVLFVLTMTRTSNHRVRMAQMRAEHEVRMARMDADHARRMARLRRGR